MNSTCYRTCPNGSVVPETQSCPTVVTPGVCPQDAQICPDGSTVGRTGPNCSFACVSCYTCSIVQLATLVQQMEHVRLLPSTCTYSLNDPYVSRLITTTHHVQKYVAMEQQLPQNILSCSGYSSAESDMLGWKCYSCNTGVSTSIQDMF